MRPLLRYLLFVFGVALAACASNEADVVEVSAEVTPIAEQSAEQSAEAPQPTSTLMVVDNTPAPTDEAAPTAEPEPTATTSTLASHLPNLGVAPNIANETWLNVDEPLSLEALRGKVVLVEFWTFG